MEGFNKSTWTCWLNNENKNLKNNPDLTYRTVENVTVYDNTSGSLVPFGTINEGTVNQAINIMGDWLQIDFAGRVGYIIKSAVQIGSFMNINTMIEH